MSKFWCAVLVAALSSTALARGGDDSPDGKKIDENRMKSLSELSAELEAQKAQLEAQRLQIQALQTQAGAMSLEGNGTLADPQAQAKPALPEQIKSKWAMNIYGFIEADFISDNHQLVAQSAAAMNGAVDAAGNPVWPTGRQYATEHGSLTFGARNSRIGLNVAAPEYGGIRASGKLEMDFLGVNGGANNEAGGTWTNPSFRIRHMYLTLDNDYVTVTLGQGWELFGWQPYFHPNTVDIQGVPGQIYSRSPKAQFSHKFNGPVDIELAFALSRPPERAADEPDLQAGIKFAIPDWVGVHTIGAAGTAVDAAAIGLSGTTRSFRVPNAGAAAVTSDATRGEAGALDIFLPILHPDKESKANSLSLTGELVYGKGINDLYTGFTGGIAAIGTGIADAGSVGIENGDLTPVQWRTNILGLQYYLPPDGNWWVAVNYSSGKSNNMHSMANAIANPATVYHAFRWLNADIFWDVTPAVRLGLSVDQYRDSFLQQTPSHFGDDTRIQFSAFYLF